MNISDIFKSAAEKKASDIHLVAGLPPIFRINGKLGKTQAQALDNKSIERLVFSILTPEQKERFVSQKELDFGFELDGIVRLRVNLHYERSNVGMVARLISGKIPTLEDIEMPEVIYKLLGLDKGLILVTGPTGCGKSTTLAAMINYINQKYSYNVITLEDPIEYIFHPDKSVIIQRQLGSDMINFAEGLKHALRQDPDVIMVGEMRDLETIATTITLAETGHLVLATLHTYSAAQTINRIIDIFPSHQQSQIRLQLSLTLAGVISQRLLPTTDGSRTAAREIMVNTPATANIIRENKIPQISSVIETGSKEGMICLDKSVKELYKKGRIDKEVAEIHMKNPEML